MLSLLSALWFLLRLASASIAFVATESQASSQVAIPWFGDTEPKAPGKRHAIPGLYKRRYSEITWVGAHNSEALRTAENGWSLSGNQYFNLTVQLDSGVRLIQAQGHHDISGTNQIRLCHFNCALLDGGSLDTYLEITKAWLEANPDEFITFLFVNTGVGLDQWAEAYRKAGFDSISYVPPKNKRHGRMSIEDWPSVNAMIESGNRAVTFLSRQANESLVPFLLPEFDYMFETPFSNFEPTPQFSCSPSRPYSPPEEIVPNRLTLVNHFLYGKLFGIAYPYVKQINHTNGAGFTAGELGEHAVRCRALYERRPNFLLVDFFNEGNVWDVEHGLNQY